MAALARACLDSNARSFAPFTDPLVGCHAAGGRAQDAQRSPTAPLASPNCSNIPRFRSGWPAVSSTLAGAWAAFENWSLHAFSDQQGL